MSQDSIQSLGQFLASLEGDKESEGTFTLDADKAKEKMQTYALLDPALYVVELVAFAVSSGATYFHAKTSAGWTTFWFDGEPLSNEEFRTPLSPLYGDGGDARRLHLALALTGAKALSPNGVNLLTPKRCLNLTDDEWSVGPGQKSSHPYKLEVNRSFRGLSERFRFKPGLADVLAVCGMAPLELRVDDKWIRNYVHGPYPQERLAGSLLIQGKPELTAFKLEVGLHQTVDIDEELSAVFYISDPDSARKEGLKLIHNGICLDVRSHPFSPCVSGAIVYNQLRRDLSGQGVVEDRAYDQLFERLQKHLDTYLVALVESPMRMRPATILCAPALKHLQDRDLIKNWFESLASTDQSASELIEEALTLRTQGLDTEADEKARVALELSLQDMNSYYWDVPRLLTHGEQLRWLVGTDPSDPRIKQALDFQALCQGIQQTQAGAVHPVAQSLLLRRLGQPNEALECLPEGPGHERYRTELLLALKRDEQAEQLINETIKQRDLDTGYIASDEIAYWELKADIQELREGFKASLPLRKTLLKSGYDDFVHALRLERLSVRLRGQVHFIEWLDWKAQATAKRLAQTLTFNSQSIPSNLKKTLAHRLPEPCLEQEALKLFDDSGSIYTLLFDYICTRTAQSYRLHRSRAEADRFLAYSHLLVRARKSFKALTDGSDELC